MKNKNIKITIAYDGTGYLGWQRLGGKQQKQSIQGMLETVIGEIVQYPVRLTGSGRTDAGVHAKGQVANFSVPSAFLTEGKKIEERLHFFCMECNKQLPEDIRILDATYVSNDFHSRYDAKQKTYCYYIDTRKEAPCVFSRKYALWVPEKLDVGKMKQAVEILLGTHDFLGFSSKSRAGIQKKQKDTVRMLYSVEILSWKHGIYFSFTADGFLYNMVRILTGTLLEVGTGKRGIQQVRQALEKKDRQQAGATVSSVGLFLEQVDYK